jgi:KipI family sensor histidine kinase inhibitor
MLQIESLSEDALLIRFGDAIDPSINARVHAATARLKQLPDVECVPAYASLLLRFDPARWAEDAGIAPHQCLRDVITTTLQALSDTSESARQIDIPVLYDDETGPDLAAIAMHTGLSIEEVIARHTAVTYRVAMLGFAPGFPYLLGLDPTLAMPRRADPRKSVPAGSVAIGGNQTGIYPQALPGGWQLIGRTPLTLFDLRTSSPSLLWPGDQVRFQPIDQQAYRRLQAGQA